MQEFSEHHDDLDWLACQYVLGEMSDNEVTSFEDRLAEDQAAREAVAHLVQITDAVVTIQSETPPSPPQRSHASRLALVASATALVAVLLIGRPVPRDEAGAIESNSSSNNALVVRSSAVLDAWGQMELSDALTDQEISPPSVESPELFAEAGTPELSVPDWLLAAVELDDELAPETLENRN